jgi:hypothetical protein
VGRAPLSPSLNIDFKREESQPDPASSDTCRLLQMSPNIRSEARLERDANLCNFCPRVYKSACPNVLRSPSEGETSTHN